MKYTAMCQPSSLWQKPVEHLAFRPSEQASVAHIQHLCIVYAQGTVHFLKIPASSVLTEFHGDDANWIWWHLHKSALVLHESVAESAVVGYPHDIKGQGIYAYVTLMAGVDYTDELKAELIKHVRTEIGPVATPDVIHWAPGLPKTRSGKIMRRILRKIAEDDYSNLGDTSTLADPSVVDDLINSR